MWNRLDALVLLAATTAKLLLLLNPELDCFMGASKLWHLAAIIGALRVLRFVTLMDKYVISF